jgi:sortase A
MRRAILPDPDVALGVECALPVAQGLCGDRDRRPRWARGVATVVAAALLAAGVWQLGQGAYIHAKARLAQALMGQAWARTLEGEREVKPWPWADTWPVARLVVPALDVDLFVLAGADGRTIAFGPGHVFGTPLPGEAGNSAIGGHRDTHLAFLRDLEVGAELVVERPDGARRRYRIDWTSILDKREVWVLKNEGPTRLTLITCYPFDALRAGGPLRYVATARALEGGR